MAEVVICYSHITPRLVRRIECLAERVPGLVAMEIAGSESAYPWWQGSQDLGKIRVVRLFPQPLEGLTQAEIIRAARVFLETEQPELAILTDYSHRWSRFIARWVKQHGGRTILQAVSWAGDHQRWAMKEWAKGWVVRRSFDAVCASGERARAYCESLGFSSPRIWKQFNVVDNEHFASHAELARFSAPALRKSLGLPEHFFLFVGALEPWKNLPFLLDCYARYRVGSGGWGLVVVGTGSLQESLQSRIEHERIPGVVFVGMKKHGETPTYYGLASCFVLPSLSEPWGLVVNEAEAAGLPVLASNKCGCVPELVHRGINGYHFDPTDTDELVSQLHLISGGRLDLQRMGRSSRDLIQYYTPDRWADALADCVRYLKTSRVAVSPLPS